MLNNMMKKIRDVVSENGKVRGSYVSILFGSSLIVVCLIMKIILRSGMIGKIGNLIQGIRKKDNTE
ncbi:MAG: hypothetical protein KAH32_01880 [Chlamydiia bacterium]|nr:hypothetical protein [Chlamydiia bacterium]